MCIRRRRHPFRLEVIFMSLTRTGTLGLATATAAALFTGCSGTGGVTPSSSQAQPQSRAQRPGFGEPMSMVPRSAVLGEAERGKGLVFVNPAKLTAQVDTSEFGNSSPSNVYDFAQSDKSNGKPLCSFTTGEGVNAITLNNGLLWVPEAVDITTGQPQVISYAANCGAQGKLVYSDPDGQPADIAFAPDGTVYVGDIAGPSSSNGNVAVYPKGKTAPTSTLTYSKANYIFGVAVDSSNNLFVSFIVNSGKNGILEFKAGKMPGKVLKAVKVPGPGVPIIDKNQNLVIPDTSALTVSIYAPPSSKLTSSFPLKGISAQCALDEAQKNMFCADTSNESVDTYTYPAGTYEYSFNDTIDPSANLIGIATDPA
jgi:hypothetical protein